uniref:Uncharacterized protein n=1 Tax=Chromera velia CCMP2878 TaxID=1169474 RepID=A0A0G4HRQ2_9ALVE|eukprot:Cvel_8122.t1-p1 / transcript=Cvel_8122.t1 / gene=Cvel_8122 / organism=Chromera_velia_CCMP2878 / gene_product=hypothetical protein / transcript_product=hypothetical protein / location=Cvel_scaffold442:192-1257(-) / protein_length=137 / sequence_SO=supercontig / SO=protein_coding / is_pseudo=false
MSECRVAKNDMETAAASRVVPVAKGEEGFLTGDVITSPPKKKEVLMASKSLPMLHNQTLKTDHPLYSQLPAPRSDLFKKVTTESSRKPPLHDNAAKLWFKQPVYYEESLQRDGPTGPWNRRASEQPVGRSVGRSGFS